MLYLYRYRSDMSHPHSLQANDQSPSVSIQVSSRRRRIIGLYPCGKMFRLHAVRLCQRSCRTYKANISFLFCKTFEVGMFHASLRSTAFFSSTLKNETPVRSVEPATTQNQ